ncbi:hypothetical protein BDV12DRAFT_179169 [Aspergillus spectabilis]
MKASIILLAASAGLALAQQTSSVCPSPGAPVPACCFTQPWTAEHYPFNVCLTAASSENSADFEESCRPYGRHVRAQCCPPMVIAEDENDNSHDDLLCRNPTFVA